MRRLFQAITIAFAAMIFCVAGSTTAMAAVPHSAPQLNGTISGPTPVPAPTAVWAARDVCPFAVQAAFPVNRVVAYTYTDKRGRVVAQYFTGTLIGRITRLDDGKVITVDLSGDGAEVYDQAGNATLYGVGPYLVSLHAGDSPDHELAQPSGVSELRITASGTKTLVFASHVRNLCEALG